MLTVQNLGLVRLRVEGFDVVELPVYACFSGHISSKILCLVYETGRDISGEEVGEGEAVAYEGNAFRGEC
jgi:hypothetical protein